jgi:glucuronide carrier protein
MATMTIVGAGNMDPQARRRDRQEEGLPGFGVIGVVAGVGITLSPPSTVWVPLLFFALMGISTAGVNTLMWALEADTVEYGEWKTGVRTEGITIGLGGYVGGVAAQSESAVNAIFFRYPLTEQTFARMVAETAARRAERVASAQPVPE